MEELMCYFGKYLATPYVNINTSHLNESQHMFYKFFENQAPNINSNDFIFKCMHNIMPITYQGCLFFFFENLFVFVISHFKHCKMLAFIIILDTLFSFFF